MSFIFYNPNPKNKFVGDCVVRAISRLTHQDWRTTFRDLCDLGDDMCDMPSADHSRRRIRKPAVTLQERNMHGQQQNN